MGGDLEEEELFVCWAFCSDGKYGYATLVLANSLFATKRNIRSYIPPFVTDAERIGKQFSKATLWLKLWTLSFKCTY